MKYFHVRIDQAMACGVWEDLYLTGETEEEISEKVAGEAYDILADYFYDDDEDEFAGWEDTIEWKIEEISKEEYDEMMGE